MLRVQNINFLPSTSHKTGQDHGCNFCGGTAESGTISACKAQFCQVDVSSLSIGIGAIGVLAYLGLIRKGKLGKNFQNFFGKGGKIPKKMNTVNKLSNSSSDSSRISSILHIPSNEEKLKVRLDTVKRLESEVCSLINRIEKNYVSDIKEYLYLHELGLKKKSILSKKRQGIKALQNLKEYDIVSQNASEITIKKKNDNKLLRCSYTDEYLDRISVEDNGEVTRTIYLQYDSKPPIVRVAENTPEGNLDFIDFTFDHKEPKLATYTTQDDNKELSGLIYHEDSNSYDVRYYTFAKTLPNGEILPSIPGNFIFGRKQLKM